MSQDGDCESSALWHAGQSSSPGPRWLPLAPACARPPSLALELHDLDFSESKTLTCPEGFCVDAYEYEHLH